MANYLCGIDIGSTTVKLVLLDGENQIVYKNDRRHGAHTQKTLSELLQDAKSLVGEILVKYMPLANNHLVELLEREGAEAVVPDLLDFLCYSVYNGEYKHPFLGERWKSAAESSRL